MSNGKHTAGSISIQHFPEYWNRTAWCVVPEHWRAECRDTGFYRDSFISGADARADLEEYIAKVGA